MSCFLTESLLDESVLSSTALPANTFIVERNLQMTPTSFIHQNVLRNTLQTTNVSLQRTMTLSELQLTPTIRHNNPQKTLGVSDIRPLQNTPGSADTTILQNTLGSADTTILQNTPSNSREVTVLQMTPSQPGLSEDYSTPPNMVTSVLDAVRCDDIGPHTPVSELADNKFTSLTEAMKRYSIHSLSTRLVSDGT